MTNRTGTYIGPIAHLAGQKAILRSSPEEGFTLAQFDDPFLRKSTAERLTFGQVYGDEREGTPPPPGRRLGLRLARLPVRRIPGEPVSTQHFNRLTEAQAELLTLCFEEASEVIKEIAKIMRHGLTSHDPTDPLRTLNMHRLARELGQLSTSAAFLVKAGIIPAGEMEWAAEDRWTSVRQYLHHQPPELFERAQEPTPPAVPVADLAGVDLGRCEKCGAAYGSTCGAEECAGTNGSSAFEDRPPPPLARPFWDASSLIENAES